MSYVFHILDFSTSSSEGSVDLESNVDFLFAVKEMFQKPTPPSYDGTQYIIREEDSRSTIRVFEIKLSDLLVYHKTENYVADMLLRQCDMTQEDIHDFTREISTLACEAAKVGLEKRSKFMIHVDVVVLFREEREDMEVIGDDEEPSFNGVPASRKNLETRKYGGESEETCVVCMEEFSIGVDVKRMPCSHIFHGKCFVNWLENSNLCPLCRFEMPIKS